MVGRSNNIVEVEYKVNNKNEEFLESRNVYTKNKYGNPLLSKIKMYSIIFVVLYVVMVMAGLYADINTIGYNRKTKSTNLIVKAIKNTPVTKQLIMFRKRVIVFKHYGWEKATEPDETLLRISDFNAKYDETVDLIRQGVSQFEDATEKFKEEYTYYDNIIKGDENNEKK